MERKPTSVRLTEENETKLKAISKRDGISISHAINKIIATSSLEREKSVIQNPELQEVTKKIESIEKEISLQRQRMNIFKNQIDYVIKAKKLFIKENIKIK